MQNEFSSEKKKNHFDLSLIKDKIILSEFARSALGLKISKNKTMCCHLHKESSPSLHFNDEKRFYYCFGCHKNGDVFSLIQEIKNCSFLDSIKFAASYAGINVEEILNDYSFLRNSSEAKEKKDILLRMMEDVCLYFENKLEEFFGKENENPFSYLISRGIDDKLIKKFRIGYCPQNINELIDFIKKKYNSNIGLLLDSGIFRKNQRSYDDFETEFYSILNNRIIFPIFDRFNKVIAFGGRIFKDQESLHGNNNNMRRQPKYINASDSLIFKKNEVLYGENFALSGAKLKNQMIIVEGYIDVIMMYAAGFKNCVAPLGTAISVSQIKSLWSLNDEITCCMDGDSAGFKSMISVLEKILPIIHAEKFINFVFLEKDSDPADLIEKGKVSELKNFLENKKRFPGSIIFGICLGRYKNFTIETIAAIRSRLNSYLEKISDEIIKNEYKLYFEKKLESLIKKFDDKNENSENLKFQNKKQNLVSSNQNYFYKNEITIFDEIFLYLILIYEKFLGSTGFSDSFNQNLILIKNFFSEYEIFLEILDENKKISFSDSINLLKKSEKYSGINFDFIKEKILKEISSYEEFDSVLKKFVTLKIELINLKNIQNHLQEKIANNDPSLTFEDFDYFNKIKKYEKEIQSNLDKL
jgi:DNA primase